VVGRHSDSIDVISPIDVTGLDKRLRKRRRNLTLPAIATAVIRRRRGGNPELPLRGAGVMRAVEADDFTGLHRPG
jgi:hypothetical protein